MIQTGSFDGTRGVLAGRAQAELVRFMIDTEAKHFGVYRLTDEERTAIRKGLDDDKHGRFATDEEIAELFNRYRRTA